MADHTQPGFLHATLPPGRTQVRLAAAVLAVLLAGLAAAAPFATRPLPGTEILLPVYAVATLLIDALTAALLFSLFAIARSRAFLALAAGYLFLALLVVPWVLTFPGVFSAEGLLAGERQATAWIAAARRIGFPLFVLAYALSVDPRPSPAREGRPLAAVARVALPVAALALGLAAAAILAEPYLPRLMHDGRHTAPAWRAVPALTMALYALCLFALARRGRCALDLWVAVMVAALAIELFLLSYLAHGGRFALGWWAGRIYGLIAAGVVLAALIAETTSLSLRLARATVAEARARAARVTALEALSAAIAHEVNQPLASMVTSAGAGLRWLDRPAPDLGEAREAFARIAADGLRAGEVVAGIRQMFQGRGIAARAPLDLDLLIDETLRAHAGAARLAGASLETDLARPLRVIANAAQLRQVLANLIANALDAMEGAAVRRLTVTGRVRERMAEVAVADTGSGLADPARLFEPFATTKADGMGMGLVFCRAVVEAHGGRIRAAANRPTGAVFTFALPLAEAGR